MGSKLAEYSKEAAEVFKKADSVRADISEICFNGTEEQLKITANTQPCLYTVEMAAAAALTEAGIKADMAAGFSLGELAALTYAGSLDLDQGIALVNKRAQFMQEAAEEEDTSMVAVVKLSNEKVEELARGFEHVYPVNYNCPGQVAVAALTAEIEAFNAAVKEAGGRAVPVKVSGAFHSPFMQSASDRFAAELDKISFSALQIPVYSNFTSEVYPDDIAGTLKMQIANPVKWEQIIRNMIAAGADTFIELGAGKTLRGFIKKTDPSVRMFGAESREDIEQILEEI